MVVVIVVVVVVGVVVVVVIVGGGGGCGGGGVVVVDDVGGQLPHDGRPAPDNRVELSHWSRSHQILGSHWSRLVCCYGVKVKQKESLICFLKTQ